MGDIPVPGQQFGNSLRGLGSRDAPRLCRLQYRIAGVAFFALDARDVLVHALPCFGAAIPEGAGLPFQILLQALIEVGFEDFPENPLPVLGGGQQQLEEIPLGNHGNLQKLVPVDAHDVPDGGVHLPGLAQHGAVRHGQLRLRFLHGEALSPGLGALIFRASPHQIGLVPVGKFQLHKGGCLRFRVLGAEHPCVPVVAAGLAVEGEGDGVKNRGLPRTGVAGDEVQAPLPQLVQRQRGAPGVGAEGGNRQANGSHGWASFAFSISSSRNTSCSRLMGLPFCNS